MILQVVVGWAQEFTIPVSPGFKDPSLGTHRMQVID